MADIEKWHEAMGFFTRINSRLGGIALSYLATLEKISEVSQTKWWDEDLGRFEQKMRMKEVGGAAFQFDEFLHESSIMSLAKVIEDTSIELKRFVNFKFDSVKNHCGVIYLKELQTIRALANVIKHNVSILERNSSESAKFLVDECGMKNGWELDVFIHTRHDAFNIIEHIPKVHLAMLDLVEKSLGIKHRYLDLELNDAFNEIYEFLIPEVINLPRPSKAQKPSITEGASKENLPLNEDGEKS
tara:strand:- start:986 stop:1717 length:732 start_codon:yes stop_codon:yes gene_type:complete